MSITHAKVSVVSDGPDSDQVQPSDWNAGHGGTISGAIEYVIDGGGTAITTGVKGDLQLPFAATITGWRIVADVSGSIVVDVWRDTYTNFPPVVGDSIAGSEKPTLSSATKNEDTSLSTWTTSLSNGDWLRFNVDSATTVTRVTLVILINRTL